MISAPARLAASAGRCVPNGSAGLLDRVCAAPHPPPAAAETAAPPGRHVTPAVGWTAPGASGRCRRTYSERADSARFGVVGSCHLRPGPPARGCYRRRWAAHRASWRATGPGGFAPGGPGSGAGSWCGPAPGPAHRQGPRRSTQLPAPQPLAGPAAAVGGPYRRAGRPRRQGPAAGSPPAGRPGARRTAGSRWSRAWLLVLLNLHNGPSFV